MDYEPWLKNRPDLLLEALRIEDEREARAARQVVTDSELSVIQNDREVCKSFVEFIRSAWHVLEPSNPYVHGFHVDAIACHLEAVTRGEILRLLINIPPSMAKSLIVSVLWPAWEWGPAGLPTMRYLSTSYHHGYVARDSRKMRDLVMSEWYQQRWPVELVREGEVSFENTKKGFREGVPFSRLTAGKGHRVIIDDPHSTEGAESEADRITAIRIFRESLQSRLIEPLTSAIVIIMQRLNVSDISAQALAVKIEPYVHVMLPMRFEIERACVTRIGFKDPRTKEGELLFPERFPLKVVDRDEAIMGSFAVAGQHQQRPTQREGGMFKRHWFTTVKAVPAATRWIRYWDLAASKEQVGSEAAYTVGLKLGRMPNGRFIVADVARLRAEGQGVRRLIKETARADGPHVEIGLPQDPGAAGKMVAQDMILMLAGYIVSATRESGDKIQRAEPVAAQAEAGNIDLLEGDWNSVFLDEICDFPGSKFKDQADAFSGAFSKLIGATVFDISEDYIAMAAVKVQAIWPRVGAIYISREKFTAVWLAHDPVSDTIYIYDVLTVPRQDMAIHANALKQKGPWVPMLFDPEGAGRDKAEGVRIAQSLDALGVQIFTVKFDEEAAMDVLGSRLTISSLWVFDHLLPWFAAYRRLTRNDKGEIAGDDTGVFHATGLALHSGLQVAITENRAESDAQGFDRAALDRSEITGY